MQQIYAHEVREQTVLNVFLLKCSTYIWDYQKVTSPSPPLSFSVHLLLSVVWSVVNVSGRSRWVGFSLFHSLTKGIYLLENVKLHAGMDKHRAVAISVPPQIQSHSHRCEHIYGKRPLLSVLLMVFSKTPQTTSTSSSTLWLSRP